MTDTKPTETKPPETRKSDGVAMSGGFPVNHRLRAEALAEAGKTADPDDMVSQEAIADAKARLARATEASKAATKKEG